MINCTCRHNKNDNNNNNSNNTLIIKSNTKLLIQPRRLIKCYQEFIIGSSIQSPFVVRYLDFKKYVLFLVLYSFYIHLLFTCFPASFSASFSLFISHQHISFFPLFLFLYRFDYGYAILMEDIGGTALPQLYNYAKQDLPLDIFLHIACKISMQPALPSPICIL